jgi:hypothetical protein
MQSLGTETANLRESEMRKNNEAAAVTKEYTKVIVAVESAMVDMFEHGSLEKYHVENEARTTKHIKEWFRKADRKFKTIITQLKITTKRPSNLRRMGQLGGVAQLDWL